MPDCSSQARRWAAAWVTLCTGSRSAHMRLCEPAAACSAASMQQLHDSRTALAQPRPQVGRRSEQLQCMPAPRAKIDAECRLCKRWAKGARGGVDRAQ